MLPVNDAISLPVPAKLNQFMAPETAPNDGIESPSNSLTPAQRLQEKHKADAAHRATVEDDVDEADIIHHPQPMHNASEVKAATLPEEVLSVVAAGKQKAREDSNGVPAAPKPEPRIILDTQSEESFPALGRGPKSQAPTPVAKAWGAKKPVAMGQAYLNGTNESNGNDYLSTSASSRASTPASGIWTPNSTSATASSQHRGGLNPRLSMPGNAGKECSERIQFTPAQLVPRSQLKKPILDVLRSINKRSKANVEMKAGPKDSLYFEGSGPVEAVRQALKEVAKEIGSKVIRLAIILCMPNFTIAIRENSNPKECSTVYHWPSRYRGASNHEANRSSYPRSEP